MICELTFSTTVLAVKMNRRRLIVVLEEQIFVYDISNMKLLHTIDTSPNPNGEWISLYPLSMTQLWCSCLCFITFKRELLHCLSIKISIQHCFLKQPNIPTLLCQWRHWDLWRIIFTTCQHCSSTQEPYQQYCHECRWYIACNSKWKGKTYTSLLVDILTRMK